MAESTASVIIRTLESTQVFIGAISVEDVVNPPLKRVYRQAATVWHDRFNKQQSSIRIKQVSGTTTKQSLFVVNRYGGQLSPGVP